MKCRFCSEMLESSCAQGERFICGTCCVYGVWCQSDSCKDASSVKPKSAAQLMHEGGMPNLLAGERRVPVAVDLVAWREFAH